MAIHAKPGWVARIGRALLGTGSEAPRAARTARQAQRGARHAARPPRRPAAGGKAPHVTSRPRGSSPRARRLLSVDAAGRETPGEHVGRTSRGQSGEIAKFGTRWRRLEHPAAGFRPFTPERRVRPHERLGVRPRVVPTPPRAAQPRGPSSRATKPSLRLPPRSRPPGRPRAQRGRGRRVRSEPRPPCVGRAVGLAPERPARCFSPTRRARNPFGSPVASLSRRDFMQRCTLLCHRRNRPPTERRVSRAPPTR